MKISRKQLAVIGLIGVTLLLIGFAIVLASQLSTSQAPEDTSAANDSGGLCDNDCTSDSDCRSATTEGVTLKCNTDIGRCVNTTCPTDTIPGNLCHCRTPIQKCGQKCGGQNPLCDPDTGTSCRYIGGPSCGQNSDTRCVPLAKNLPEGYSTPKCVARDTFNSYVSGPNGKTSFTPAEIQELCDNSFQDVCGNGEKEPSEGCDDGNTTNGDGCSSTCRVEACGNNVVEGTEQCDDGNTTSGDGCSATCVAESCGDGTRQASEACDDGNTTNGDGCSSTCGLESCGNGVVDSGEQCDGTAGCNSGYSCTNTCVCVQNVLPDTALISDEFDRILIGAILLIAGFTFIQVRNNVKSNGTLAVASFEHADVSLGREVFVDEHSARRRAFKSTKQRN